MGRTTRATQTEIDSSGPPMIGRREIADRTLHRISRYLLAARIDAGLTQAQVASRMGTTASAISRLENAAGHRPTVTTLEHYAQAVGCSLEIQLVPLPW
jgi:DNA-binding XRE family transcriptional regulator